MSYTSFVKFYTCKVCASTVKCSKVNNRTLKIDKGMVSIDYHFIFNN